MAGEWSLPREGQVAQFLADAKNADTIAFTASLLCVWGAAFAAFRVPRKSPRLFLALALFGLNWAILLLYYLPGPPQNEILASLSGFTLIYAGVLLFREARRGSEQRADWLEKLPLFLFRTTVTGFGLYLVARRLLHLEYGYGTLALALWGTLLTILGYLAIWAGLATFYAKTPAGPRVRRALGSLLAVYALCEVGYAAWYARDYWPPYHRYLTLEARASSPDFERPLPFEPRHDWPDQRRWETLRERPDWPQLRPLLALKVAPRLPAMPAALKYALSLLKVVFTAAFFVLIWRRPARRRERGGST
jgi:hypothetical protein